MSRERPIVLKAPKVRALLNGATQLRWTVKPQPITGYNPNVQADTFEWKNEINTVLRAGPEFLARHCPFGKPGDRLWVRETWDFRDWSDAPDDRQIMLMYGADGHQQLAIAPDGWHPMVYGHERWRPSIHMPRWASRILLELVSVRVERLQDISANDALAEGVEKTEFWTPKELDGRPFEEKWWDDYEFWNRYPQIVYRKLWESINGPGSWDANPWVWVVEFRRLGLQYILIQPETK